MKKIFNLEFKKLYFEDKRPKGLIRTLLINDGFDEKKIDTKLKNYPKQDTWAAYNNHRFLMYGGLIVAWACNILRSITEDGIPANIAVRTGILVALIIYAMQSRVRTNFIVLPFLLVLSALSVVATLDNGLVLGIVQIVALIIIGIISIKLHKKMY